jgi:hypothetical protein
VGKARSGVPITGSWDCDPRAGIEDMKRGLDFKQMEAAFKRAAYKAIHGTREERSGRFFLPEKTRKPPSAPPRALKKSKLKRRTG